MKKKKLIAIAPPENSTPENQECQKCGWEGFECFSTEDDGRWSLWKCKGCGAEVESNVPTEPLFGLGFSNKQVKAFADKHLKSP